MKSKISEYKANLLVVDDNPENLRILSAILVQEGYKVRKSISGKTALNTIKFETPDLILLDIKMPDMDGYKVCSILKENHETHHIPVIFLSALDKTDNMVKGFEVGGVDYITKPFQLEDVLVRIKHQLTIVKQRQELYEHNQLLIKEIQHRKQIESKLKLLLTTINLVGQAPNLNHALADVLGEVCQMTNCDYGEVWMINQNSRSLKLDQAYYQPADQSLKTFYKLSLEYSFSSGAKLIGQVWKTQQIKWIEDISRVKENIFSRVNIIQNTGLKTVFAVPISIKGRVFAIMCFFLRSSIPYNPELLELVNAVALELSGFIERKQTEESLKQANKELLRLANLDGLTEIANRRCFNKSLEQEWLRMKREKSPISLLLCDIDYFKLYNDFYGHQAGDDCLRRVAIAMTKSCQRPADLVARYGGEEFGILLPHTDLEGAIHMTKQIQLEMEKIAIPHQCSYITNQVTLSIGVASMIPINETLPEVIIAAADQALYRAKAQGRNTYCIYNQDT